jgi:hypothetical protein
MDTKEPRFWSDQVMDIPVCQELVDNFDKIKEETLVFLNTENPHTKDGKSVMKYPSMLKTHKIVDGVKTDDLISITENGSWHLSAIGDIVSNPYMKVTLGAKKLLDKLVKWQTGITMEENSQYNSSQFPTFNSILSTVPQGKASGAMISILSPGTVINPHYSKDGYIRCHLCIINDEGCTITVGDETRFWQEGKILAFKDAGTFPHSVIHSGTKDRVVLIFDLEFDYVKQFVDSPYL